MMSGEAEDPAGEVVMNRISRTLTQPKKQGASQAMLYATGLTPDDMCKAQASVCCGCRICVGVVKSGCGNECVVAG